MKTASTYHHLDISATLTPRKNKDRNWRRMGFSVYNLYNRKMQLPLTLGKMQIQEIMRQ
jgi:hypothetical protein